MKHHQVTYHTVPRETFDRVDELIESHSELLRSYLDQLLWWNKRINLVSRDVPRETIWEHIRHSLILTTFDVYKESPLVVDSGTGGGLPGLPLAITSPDKEFILNDIVSKKVLAVKQMAKQLRIDHISTSDRPIKNLQPNDPYLLASKHAFKIDELYKMTEHHPWETMVFYKGINFEGELKNISTPLSVDAYDLYKETKHAFYKDKALIFVSRV